MADTPSENGDQPAPAKTARRPRAKAADAAAPKTRARRARKTEPAPGTPEKVKRTARAAANSVARGTDKAEKTVARAARTTRRKVEETTGPVTTRKVALGAAAAVGVAAGVAAAVLGRKRIARTASGVIETVSDLAKRDEGHPPTSPTSAD